ncbi:MAG: FKBP-type peptidyl-prolyl cis-trans isomerase [Treponema sp.]|jgi:FKBP-type peptidyl-prolyl cis-trans isomerase FkpA|nr:FKBP-type peptidyl-prolyl cis-trans isomerase [Treponema sp.]
MKKGIGVLLVSLCVVALSHASGVAGDAAGKYSSDVQTSYAFGMLFGSQLEELGISIANYTAVAEGIRDMLENSAATRLSWDEAVAKTQIAYMEAMEKQAAESMAREAQFLEENSRRPGVLTTTSGLQYEVVEEGTGRTAVLVDTVVVNYEGAFIDGSLFDSSYERGEPEEFPLDMVIPGLSEGIQLMSEGATYRFFVPSQLAYGSEGAGNVIPPYSTVVYQVELVSILSDDDVDDADDGVVDADDDVVDAAQE